mmetsp:Transcript_30363/g.63461  ORF Transcript_30363/g.63461 Transcript_30363/m.63461 type:complete len:327 (-) Transcript_30363:355-1335(-)
MPFLVRLVVVAYPSREDVAFGRLGLNVVCSVDLDIDERILSPSLLFLNYPGMQKRIESPAHGIGISVILLLLRSRIQPLVRLRIALHHLNRHPSQPVLVLRILPEVRREQIRIAHSVRVVIVVNRPPQLPRIRPDGGTVRRHLPHRRIHRGRVGDPAAAQGVRAVRIEVAVLVEQEQRAVGIVFAALGGRAVDVVRDRIAARVERAVGIEIAVVVVSRDVSVLVVYAVRIVIAVGVVPGQDGTHRGSARLPQLASLFAVGVVPVLLEGHVAVYDLVGEEVLFVAFDDIAGVHDYGDDAGGGVLDDGEGMFEYDRVEESLFHDVSGG